MPELSAAGIRAVPFSLVRFRTVDSPPVAGLLVDGRILPLAETINELLAVWEASFARLVALAEASDGWLDASSVTLVAPVEPRQVIQAGANYRTHVIELAMSHRPESDPRSEDEARAEIALMMDTRASSGIPYFFIGLPTVVVGDNVDLVLPAYSDRHDWELELTVVIGAEAFQVSPADARRHIAGYTIVNDISTRDLIFRRDMPEIGTDWFRGKNAPGFLPTGPELVPAAFVDDPENLRITLTLNGETMQDALTNDLLFGIDALVSAASHTTRLYPGDLLLTGSPAGNGQAIGRFLTDGDVMVGSITGLGSQTVRCVAEVTR
ncbi:fumarylacetoacetate hydrolase family protein [Lacisediminihabitans sp. FW035]